MLPIVPVGPHRAVRPGGDAHLVAGAVREDPGLRRIGVVHERSSPVGLNAWKRARPQNDELPLRTSSNRSTAPSVIGRAALVLGLRGTAVELRMLPVEIPEIRYAKTITA